MTDLRLNPRETSTMDACSVTLLQWAGISDGRPESMDIFWSAEAAGTTENGESPGS
ncbi:hypothetical protein ABZ471_15800 [Streptomyces sp. NPDC005728]|uniref:hypothetical protein n=1 Tax=Streptomyces sp. NPDC005728 TaxID=3157054 RepID=UPI0033F8FDA5